ncbi:MAG TPA: SDR family oxidoreductase [Thermoleophilaceae bacterium]|jgi:nucleoside-diphosphate-sugar epimerase
MAGSRQPTVLLTGASGVVGRAVAEELSGHRVIGTVHADADVPVLDEVLRCDLAEERLGLDAERWDRLAGEVDAIVHSGALTQWGQPRELYERVNVGGTRRVIELAQAAGAPVHYVGTCFVKALMDHSYDEMSEDNVVRPYVWSKLESERLLAESGVPFNVFRPTNLVGHSETGASSRPQIVQAMSDWICRGKAPYFPAHPGNLVDVVPLDVLAVAVARAVEMEDLGHEHWVTYGAEAMTVEEALDVVVEHAARLGRDIERARVVDPREPLPIPLEEVPATSRSFVKVLIDVSETTHLSGGVLPSSLPELRERYGVPEASDAEAYRRSLEYWAAERGTMPARATTKEAT